MEHRVVVKKPDPKKPPVFFFKAHLKKPINPPKNPLFVFPLKNLLRSNK